MGPFPYDGPAATISDDNPMGTDGFEFVEFAHSEPAKLTALFELMGFSAVARHRSKNVTLYRQGGVNYSRQCRAGQLRGQVCKKPWAVRLRNGLPRRRCRACA